jgi:hypothetical protein
MKSVEVRYVSLAKTTFPRTEASIRGQYQQKNLLVLIRLYWFSTEFIGGRDLYSTFQLVSHSLVLDLLSPWIVADRNPPATQSRNLLARLLNFDPRSSRKERFGDSRSSSVNEVCDWLDRSLPLEHRDSTPELQSLLSLLEWMYGLCDRTSSELKGMMKVVSLISASLDCMVWQVVSLELVTKNVSFLYDDDDFGCKF